MCYQQHYHYTQCDHWIHKLSVCLERKSNSDKCPLEESREAHYDDHCRSCIAYTKQLPKALRHLRLNDRFRARAVEAVGLTFNTVEYDEYDALQEAPDDDDDKANPSLAVEVGEEFDCESPRCTFGLPSPPLVSPTSFNEHHLRSQHTDLKCDSRILDPSNAILKTCPGGANQMGCGVLANPGNSIIKPHKENTGMKVHKCKYGNGRPLDQIGDVPSMRLCVWHYQHRSVEDQAKPCLALQVDATYR